MSELHRHGEWRHRRHLERRATHNGGLAADDPTALVVVRLEEDLHDPVQLRDGVSAGSRTRRQAGGRRWSSLTRWSGKAGTRVAHYRMDPGHLGVHPGGGFGPGVGTVRTGTFR